MNFDISINEFIKLNKIQNYKIIKINDKEFNNLGFAFMLNKDKIKLKDEINIAIDKLEKEGQIDKLRQKYSIK